MRSSFDQYIKSLFVDVVRDEDDMHLWQTDAVDFLEENPFSALFIDLGLGKTIISLTLIVRLIFSFLVGEREKILIVGPRKVVTETWPDEFKLWAHTCALRFTLLSEDEDDPRLAAARRAGREHAKQVAADWDMPADSQLKAFYAQKFETAQRVRIRQELAQSSPQIHIVSRDNLEWLCNFYKRKWPYRIVFVDESSNFKDQSTNRFKALAKVRRTPGLIRRLHLLTATPAAETYEHLWAQTYLMDLGQRLGKGITKFREKYFTFNRYSMTYKIRSQEDADEILKKIADICMVMDAKDYLDMPEPVFIPRKSKMLAHEQAIYDKMREDSLIEMDDGGVVEAENAAALGIKLQQIASGVLYETQFVEDPDNDENADLIKVRKVHHIHDHKIERLKELMDEAQGRQVLVAYHFKSSHDRLKKAFSKATVMDRAGKQMGMWNKKKMPYPMMMIHPMRGAYGLNMQHGGHILVFFDIPWSFELYYQLIGRLKRQGQVHVVLIYLLMMEGTIDERIFEALLEKTDTRAYLIRSLKKEIKLLRKMKAARRSSDVPFAVAADLSL